MKKVKPFFQLEIGASEKSSDISKIWDNEIFFCHVPRPTKFQEKP